MDFGITVVKHIADNVKVVSSERLVQERLCLTCAKSGTINVNKEGLLATVTTPFLQIVIDLIRELKEKGDFCIGSGCYPEVHPEAANMMEDIRHLKEKVDAGCDFLTSQLFFDNGIFYDYLYKVREAGIAVPVIPGIMPVTNAKQMERSIEMSGSFIPRHFKALLERFGNNDAAMKQAGIAYATEQIIDLYANGVKNVHVYTMNNPEVAEKIMANVKDLLG